MPTVELIMNQYRGINAHLHSRFQAEPGWNSFHTRHIVHLADALQQELAGSGFRVEVEESLQVRRIEPPVGFFDTGAEPASRDGNDTSAIQSIALPELFDEYEPHETPFRAIALYPRAARRYGSSQPILWMELLSPTGKGDSSDARKYRSRRLDLLMNGRVFVELDYLHETPPTFAALPAYYPVEAKRTRSRYQPHPYQIVVVDSRPDYDSGRVQLAGFDVDQAIPPVYLPLSEDDGMIFDFGQPYRYTFEAGEYGREVDYTELPLHFERYRPQDQRRIALRMLAVLQSTDGGPDGRSHAMLSPQELTLDDALRQIEALTPRVKGGR